jgi:hypothetical protein
LIWFSFANVSCDMSHMGNYKVKFENEAGSDESTGKVTIKPVNLLFKFFPSKQVFSKCYFALFWLSNCTYHVLVFFCWELFLFFCECFLGTWFNWHVSYSTLLIKITYSTYFWLPMYFWYYEIIGCFLPKKA